MKKETTMKKEVFKPIQLGNLLRDCRKMKNLTLQQLSDLSKVSFGAIRSLEKGLTKSPDFLILKRLSDALETPFITFLTTSGYLSENAINTCTNTENISVPLYDLSASAGVGAYVFDEQVEKYINLPKIALQGMVYKEEHLLSLKVNGDSMKYKLEHGDIILIDSSITAVSDGKISVFKFNDDLYVKTLRRDPSGGIKVISENKDYETFLVSPDKIESGDFKIIGQVLCTVMKKWV